MSNTTTAQFQEDSSCGTVDVLHVPFTYFPDAIGGTEVYVAGLVSALREQGVSGAVAAPGETERVYEHEGTTIFRFARDRHQELAHAYGQPDEDALQSFLSVLARTRPHIVHMHARTAAVSDRLVDAAHGIGAKVVFTYHTPTVSCVRGTMMHMGRTPCDGRLNRHRCVVCTLQGRGVPSLLGEGIATLPQSIGEILGHANCSGGLLTALRMPTLVGDSHKRFHALMEKVDRIVVVSEWVGAVLRINDVPQAKLTLCRQGMTRQSIDSVRQPFDTPSRAARAALRLGFFGRLDPTKGVDILIDALQCAPDARVTLDIYGVRQPNSEKYVSRIERAASVDSRVVLHPALNPASVIATMHELDLIVIPSRWLETGPLVALEAFAAGVPVLGSRLGGIMELITDDVDGVLVAPADPIALGSTIASLARDADRVARLRRNVRQPRTMEDVGAEMAALYQILLAGDGH